MVGSLLTSDAREVCHGGQEVSNPGPFCRSLAAIAALGWTESFEPVPLLCRPPQLIACHAHLPAIFAVVLLETFRKGFEMGIMQEDA